MQRAGKDSRMARLISWLLNVVYLALLVARVAVARSGQRCARQVSRRLRARSFLGLVPRRDGRSPVRLAARGERRRSQSAGHDCSRELRSAHPDWEFVISTTTATGYDLARKKYADRTVFYCPLDFSWAVRRAMRRMRPTLLVLAELELWPNLIAAAQAARRPRRDHQRPAQRPQLSAATAACARSSRRVLRQIDLIAAQNDESAERFRALGAPRRARARHRLAQVRRRTNRSRQSAHRGAARSWPASTTTTSCSSPAARKSPKKQYAIDIFRRLAPQHPRLRLILVPRHPERFDAVAKLLDAADLPWQRRSSNSAVELAAAQPGAAAASCSSTPSASSAPGGAPRTIAFVGGSFGSRGGQNMIEPAAYGAAVSFGPNTWNFRDIVAALLAADAAVVVHDADELEAFVRRASTIPPGPTPSASGPNASSAPSSEQPHARSNCSMPCCRRLKLESWGARPRDFAARGADRQDAPNCPRVLVGERRMLL